MKKFISNKLVIVALVLVTLIAITPLVNASGIFADQDSSFQTSFVDGTTEGTIDYDDYRAEGSGVVLNTNFMLEHSTDVATMTYVIPSDIEVLELPEVDGEIIDVEKDTSSSTETVVTITFDKDADIFDGQLSFTLKVSPDKFYSGEEYEIESTFSYADGTNADLSNTNKITMYDYYANSTIETTIKAISDPIILDTSIEYNLYNLFNGEYKELVDTKTDEEPGYSTEFTNVELDLSKILISTDGGSTYQSVGDLGYEDAISVTTGQSYDSTTGILTLPDYTINGYDFAEVPFELVFSSDKFPADAEIIFPSDISSADVKENGTSKDANVLPLDSNAYGTIAKDLNVKVRLDEGSYVSGVKPNESDLYLFSILLTNQGYYLNDTEITVNIPAGMTITELSNPNDGDVDGYIIVEDEAGNKTTVGNASQEILTQSIVGPQDVTLTIEHMDPADINYNEERVVDYISAGIRFVGEIDGNDGEVSTVRLYDDMSADYYEQEGDTPTNGSIDNIADADDKYLDIDLVKQQSPALNITANKYYDENGTNVNLVGLGDSVTVESVVSIQSRYFYGTPYQKLDDPSFFISIPDELKSISTEFSKEDIDITVNGVNIDDKIVNVEEIDASEDASVYTDGKLIRIDLEDFTLTTDELTINVNTVVDDSLKKVTKINGVDYNTIVATTDTQNYKDLRGGGGTASIDYLQNQDGINEGNQAGNSSPEGITITIPSEVGAKTFVNTNNENDDFRNVDEDSDKSEYPEIYLGENGTYKMQMYNTSGGYKSETFTSYILFPDLSEYGVQLDVLNPTIDTGTGSVPVKTYYTTDTDIDTTDWDTGDYSSANWSETPSEDATAMYFEFSEMDANTFYTIDIDFDLDYAISEDSVTYDEMILGKSVFQLGDKIEDNSKTAGVVVVKSNPPTIELNSIADGDTYKYNSQSTFQTDVLDYLVEDDRTDELVVYEDSKFDNGNSDDLASISVEYTDLEENVSSMSGDEFAAISKYPAGNYVITYTTEQDADAQVTTKVISTSIKPENAVLDSDNLVVDYSDAPISDAEIIAELNPIAVDYDGTPIDQSQITISDHGTYDTSNNGGPQIGIHTITFSVTGASKEPVTHKATITVTNNKLPEISASNKSVAYSDVPTEIGSTDADIIAYLETQAVEYNGIDLTGSVTITDDGGFDFSNYTVGTYNMTLSVTGDAGTVTTPVTLTITSDGEVNEITSSNLTLDLEADLALLPTQDSDLIDLLSVEAYDATGDITNTVTIDSSLDYTDYPKFPVGSYSITFDVNYTDGSHGQSTSVLTITAPDAQISANDVTITYDELQTFATIKDILEVEGGLTHSDFDGSDISNTLNIDNKDNLTIDKNTVAGNYDFTISVVGHNGNTVEKNIVVYITEGASKITATNATVEYLDAPKDDLAIISTLSAEAKDYLKNDISSELIITNYGGYDFDNIVAGDYEITFDTTDELATPVTVTLTVNPGASVITAESEIVEYVNAPKNDDGIISTLSAEAKDYLKNDISSELIITNYGGYDFDNIVAGDYEITFDTTDELAEPVSVILTVNPGADVIDASNSTVEYVDAPKDDAAIIAELDASAKDYLDNVITSEIFIASYGGYDVDNIVAGDYTIVLSTSDDFSTTKTVTLTVNPGASVISAEDKTVAYADAPTTDAGIIAALEAAAKNYLDQDISGQLIITDYSGYDVSNIVAGKYEITFDTTDGLATPVTVTLTVEDEIEEIPEGSTDIESEDSTDGTSTEDGSTIMSTGFTTSIFAIFSLIALICTILLVKRARR